MGKGKGVNTCETLQSQGVYTQVKSKRDNNKTNNDILDLFNV